MSHKHAYQRLSDEAVFCRECGDIKRADPPICTLPHYPYVPPVIYPTIIPWRPYQPRYWWSSGTITTGQTYEIGDTIPMPDGSSITYTAES